MPWVGFNAEDIRKLCIDDDDNSVLVGNRFQLVSDEYALIVHTETGDVPLNLGDWVVKDDRGSFRCYTPELFEATFNECKEF